MNIVLLQGRLTHDVELKTLTDSKGTMAAKFSLAVDRAFKNKNGERETDFILCQAYGKTAEIIEQYFNKGDGIIVQGNLQINQGKDGTYYTNVVVNQFYFPIGKAFKNQNNNQNAEDTGKAGENFSFEDIDEEVLPFNL